MTPIAPQLTAFVRERLPLQRGASAHTGESDADTCPLLLTCAHQRLHLQPSALCREPLDAALVMTLLAHLEAERGNSPSTRNTRWAAIKSCGRCLASRVPSRLAHSRRVLAIPTQKTAVPLLTHLSMTEMHAILEAPNVHTRTGLRDRAMRHLGFAAGLRVAELITLPRTAVTFSPTPAVQVHGQGRRERARPLWQQTAEARRAWGAVRGNLAGPALFLSTHSRAMTRVGCTHVLRQDVGIAAHTGPTLEGQHVTPHVLRHTCAMMLLQATGALRQVSLWLGHAERHTTAIYLRADPTDTLAALEAVMPPALRRGHCTVPDTLIALLHGA
jgi:integrase/recombinase XerD